MNEQHFTTVIKPKSGWFDLHLKEVFAYRDLIFLFVKRNFMSKYKQTVLGPAWAIIQPLLTTVVFTLVFGNIAGLAPDGVPSFVFYLSGTVFFKLPHTNGEYLCCQQCNNGKGVFSPACNADFNGLFGAYQPCDSICVFDYLSRLLCSSKTRGAA